MNVLILSDLIVNSGVGQYMCQLAGELHDKGHDVVLASAVIFRTDIPTSVKVVKLCNGGGKYLLKYIRQLHAIIKENNIEIVHCNHRRQTFLMHLYQLLYGRIAVVWTCHTVPYPNNWLKRVLGYYGHKVIAISSEARLWLKEELKIDDKHLDLITNGVDNKNLILPAEDKADLKKRFFKDHFDIDINGSETRVIVLHGRLAPVKGIDLFIGAFARLNQDQMRNVEVVLTGDMGTPYYEELCAQIYTLGLENKFHFAGWMNSCPILQIADIMVLTSRQEGFPLSCMEAFFMKVPVIRTKMGGYLDMMDFCVGVPSEDVNAIYEQLVKWIQNPESFDSLVPKAYEYAMKDGTIGAMTEKTITTYKNAILLCGR